MARQISTVDTIVSPFYDLDVFRKRSIAIAGAIVNYAERQGKNPDRLFVLSLGSPDHFEPEEHPYGVGYARVLQDYFEQSANFLQLIRNSTANLFIGTKHDIELYSHTTNCFGGKPVYIGRFNFFLQEGDLELDSKNLVLIGHGLHKDGCVDEFLKSFANAVEERHNVRVSCRVNDETAA